MRLFSHCCNNHLQCSNCRILVLQRSFPTVAKIRLTKISYEDQLVLSCILLRFKYVSTIMTDSYRASSLRLMPLMPSTAIEGEIQLPCSPSSNFAAIVAKISVYAFTAC